MKKAIRILTAAVISLTFASTASATEPAPAVNSDTYPGSFDVEEPYENQIDYDDLYFNGSLFELDEEGQEEVAFYGFGEVDNELARQIIEYAQKYLGRPYVYGAVGPKSFDCSGFTSYVFREYGITLSRTSRQQATQGVKVATKDVKPGDLLFFSGRGGGSTVGHVAMAVDVDDNGVITFIHASCSKGISYATYPDKGYYSKRYLGARRVIEDI